MMHLCKKLPKRLLIDKKNVLKRIFMQLTLLDEENWNRTSVGQTLEWRRIARFAGVYDPSGLEGAIKILGGCIVLSECRRPGNVACTRNRLESGDDASIKRDRRLR